MRVLCTAAMSFPIDRVRGRLHECTTQGRTLDEQTQVLSVRITFPEVNRLEYVSGRDSIVLSRLQEQGDLLHLLKGHLRLWNLPDRLLPSGIEAVDKPAEDLRQRIGILDTTKTKQKYQKHIFLSFRNITKHNTGQNIKTTSSMQGFLNASGVGYPYI